MNEINFKLKFETSRKVVEANPILLEKIIFLLREEKYNVILQSQDFVTFDDSKDPLSKWRGLTSKLYEGKFEIVQDADVIEIKLTYFISCKIFLIYMVAIIIISLITTVYDLIMGGILAVFFIMEIFDQKNISDKLIDSIIT